MGMQDFVGVLREAAYRTREQVSEPPRTNVMFRHRSPLLDAIPHACPINPKTVTRQPTPEKALLGRAARMVVQECRPLIKAARVRGVAKVEQLEIQLVAKLVTKRAQECAK